MNEVAAAVASDVPMEVNEGKKPVVVVVVGMAGSGKTTFTTSLIRHVKRRKKKCYCLNLDPACLNVPFKANIDIRDTVKYKEIMTTYGLGPNGAILTCLNLFATKFDEVLALLEKRAPALDMIVLDTPGQIECFTWSASGSIILDSLAVSFPTVIAYIIDTPRCDSPITFMSNMMHSCSVMYKSRLPFILCFNKIDVRSHEACVEWQKTFESFSLAIEKEESYMATLSRSCALAMNEFYSDIRSVGVSSVASEAGGFDRFLLSLVDAKEEYHRDFEVWLKERAGQIQKEKEKLADVSLRKFEADRKKTDTGRRDEEE